MAEGGSAALVNRFYETMLGGDIEGVLALLAPDFQLVYSGPSIIPAAGTWNGRDGFQNWAAKALDGHLPPESVNFDEQIEHGDKVVIRGRVSLVVKPTGKTCESDFLHLWTVREGKLASWIDFYDTFALAQAYAS